MHLTQIVHTQIYLDELLRVMITVVVVVITRDVTVVELDVLFLEIKDALFYFFLLFGEHYPLKVLIGLLSVNL